MTKTEPIEELTRRVGQGGGRKLLLFFVMVDPNIFTVDTCTFSRTWIIYFFKVLP